MASLESLPEYERRGGTPERDKVQGGDNNWYVPPLEDCDHNYLIEDNEGLKVCQNCGGELEPDYWHHDMSDNTYYAVYQSDLWQDLW